jgi:rhodanese-related sulfurtransferase
MKKSCLIFKIAGVLTFLMMTSALLVAMAAENKISRISIDELKAMIDGGQDIVILDAQPKEVYDMEHIKGAISFPWAMKIEPRKAKSLPSGKLIVTYCDCGPGEGDSNDVAVQLKKMGFEKVMVLADPSARGWKEKGYPMEKK